MLRIGLTGGIATGKSTIAAMFAGLGAGVVDTDVVARDLVAPGSEALAEIEAEFGPEVLLADGSLDRAALRRIVFADPQRRQRLESILHPRIRRETLARADGIEARYVIFVVPLLFETGFDRLVDRVIVVDCPESVQLERLMSRDGAGRSEAAAMIDAQMARDARLAHADDVIDSSADLATTRARVSQLHEQFLQLSRNCPSGSPRAE